MQNKTIYYNIGGRVIKVTAPTFSENRYLHTFRCDAATCNIEFLITPTEEIAPPDSCVLYSDGYLTRYTDGSRTMKDEVGGGILFADRIGNGVHNVEFLSERMDAFGNMTMLKILDLPAYFIENGGLFLHASFIEADGEAILFTAEKQVGKSTQARLWKEHRNAETINGDRALIVSRNNRFYACGSPYCGTSKICHNRTLPIKAIVILSQAPENKARPATNHEGICAILNGATFDINDKAHVGLVADITEKIINSTKILRLECTPDIGAIEALEAIL